MDEPGLVNTGPIQAGYLRPFREPSLGHLRSWPLRLTFSLLTVLTTGKDAGAEGGGVNAGRPAFGPPVR